MTALAFTVPGEPRGKGRPRFVRTSGRTYTDAKTASYENLVALFAQQAMGTAKPFDGPVCVTITARFAPAASASRKARAAMLSGEQVPGRFDVDNLAKAACDGLNGIAYADDKQIASLFVRKLFAEVPGLDIVIRPYRAPEAQAVAA